MNYSDNNSLCSFNPVDYIDLDTALAEEELASITHQTTSSRNVDNYRFSLKSIDDKDLDSFRRSLITPMSINSKVQDPMYTHLTRTPTKNHMIKRQSTTSPTHSCNESVTESVALFNNILNDHDGVDLVSSDIRDFMSPYDMDDLISRPGSRLPNTTPSPQNIGRFNRDALVSRHYQPTTPTTRYTNIEKESNLNDNLLLTTTNKDTNDKVTPSISKPNAVLPNRGRKSSVDASVQTQSSVTAARRRLSTPAVDTKQNGLEQQRKQKTLLKLSGETQIHPSPPATTRIKRSDDRRRWSSHTYADDIKQELSKQENNTKNNRLSAMNPLSSRYNHKSINNTSTTTTNNLLPTSRYNTKEKRSSIIDTSDAHKQSYTSISRPVERRYSQKSSFVSDQQNETQQRSLERRVSNRNSLILDGEQRTLERRASTRNSSILDQPKVEELRGHDLERRISARKSLPPTNHNEQPQKSKLTPAPTRTTTTNLGRRSSHGALSLINNNELGKNKNEQTTRVHDITLSSRYVQRRASHRELSSTNQSSINELRSNRRVERRSSIQEPSISQQSTAKSMKRYSYHGGYGNLPTFDTEEEVPPVPTITKTTEQRRARALSVPANHPSNELKPSLMPVPVSRFRKHSNNSLSRYETVPENEVAPPAKEVRFSLSRGETTKQQHEEILPVTSRSTGGYSNSTASSSHSSGDLEYDPPTPPSSFIDKRKSMPSFATKETPRRYSSYLARLKDTYETVDVEVPRRQRVVSEDNESYKVQRRQQTGGQNAVTESARQLLAQVQQRRAKTAAILNGIYGP